MKDWQAAHTRAYVNKREITIVGQYDLIRVFFGEVQDRAQLNIVRFLTDGECEQVMKEKPAPGVVE